MSLSAWRFDRINTDISCWSRAVCWSCQDRVFPQLVARSRNPDWILAPFPTCSSSSIVANCCHGGTSLNIPPIRSGRQTANLSVVSSLPCSCWHSHTQLVPLLVPQHIPFVHFCLILLYSDWARLLICHSSSVPQITLQVFGSYHPLRATIERLT
jgi:hypothetical protein